MKTKFKYFLLAVFTVLTGVSFSSCSNDDDEDPNKGIGNYYFQLYAVETNCVDANGNSIANALRDEWITANNADANGKKFIGKTDNETARNWFKQNISALVKAYSDAFVGKLPDGGYIIYSFVLDSDATWGGARENAVIEITNSGATLH
jgi:hypothetical protein